PSLRLEPSHPVHTAPDAIAPVEPAGDSRFHRILLTTEREDELGDALLHAVAADRRFRLRSLVRAHPSLEDVFLAATKRSWDVVDAPAPRK
ncbi:MAG TPA: ABC transporter ATP-binding protein, partial [Opitutaceae bacterium]|nr:ABC transporter ATP-binding protein [Opitutaceae bacterium]